MLVRNEATGDFDSIHRVVTLAFGGNAEADLVSSLRAAGAATISLVAEEAGEIVGHIMFSPVTISDVREVRMLGLAPVAVIPAEQNRGTGSLLITSGLAECKRGGWEAVVVLGHPAYYPRFGFVPASRFRLSSEYNVPDDVFMAMELLEGALADVAGVVSYRPEFGGV